MAMICQRCKSEVEEGRRFCGACGLRQDTTVSERAERRLVTVVFADISGFTAMSEVLDPEDVHEFMNLCLEELVAVVHRYGGTVDKFIGDSVMALFGAPTAHEDDAERAIATALELRRGLDMVVERLAAKLPGPLALHAGINTGLVVAGRVGSLARNDYTVLGDTVNLAARLEDASENGQILVAENTERMTRHAFSYRALPPISVKGKREPVPVFELLGVRTERRSARGLPGLSAPFVGRSEEMAVLTGALAGLDGGRGGMITIGGPAGVGKSRLLRELRGGAEKRAVRWVQAGTSNLSQGGALTIWSDAIRRLLDLRAERGTQAGPRPIRPEAATASVAAGLGRETALLDVLAPALSEDERSRLANLEDSALRGGLFLAVRELLAVEAARGGIVLVLEDLHWADEASFELLRFVGELTAQAPLLLIATYRSEATTLVNLLPDDAQSPEVIRRHLELLPLSEEECGELAAMVLGREERMAPVRDLLVRQAEGNPFYLEEILRTLRDQGALEHSDSGGWRLTAENLEAVLPPSLQGLLLDRIDRLPEGSRRLLQVAAVAGRQFSPALLGAVAGEGASSDRIDELIRGGFLERSQSTGALRFQHALMQEAAYSSLLLRHRRSFHRRVAEMLEAQPELWVVRAELAAVLTHHWERAEEWPRAAVWALRAGEQARRAFAPMDAARLYSRALAAAGHTEDQALMRAAYAGLGDAHLLARDAEGALEALGQALALEPAGLERAALERRRGQALSQLGMQASALEAYARAAAELPAVTNGIPEPDEVKEERACLRIQTAFAQLGRGAVEPARAAAEEVLRLGVGGGDEADALRLLGVTDLLASDARSAARRFESALQIANAAGDLVRAATLTEQLGLARIQTGAIGEGEAHLRGALGRYRRLGDHAGCARCLHELGARALHTGDLQGALALLEEAAGEADAADEASLCGRAGLLLGRVLGLTGAWEEARVALELAGADDAEAAGRAELERALLEVMRGGTPEMELRRALDAAARLGQQEAEERARVGLATLARRGGRLAEARAYLRTVAQRAADPEGEAAVTALAGLAQVATAEGNAAAAVRVAARALEAAERRGPATAEWYARRIYGSALDGAGRHEAAERELRGVVGATRAAGALPELRASLSAWARARRSLGDPNGAADALAELGELAERLEAVGGRR